MDYLYLPEASASATTLDPDDHMRRHIAALRLRDGEQIVVLNGRGDRLVCRMRLARRATALDVIRAEQEPEDPTLVVCLGHLDNRDRMEFAIEKSVELGATSIVVVQNRHSQRRVVSLERYQAKAIAALTQCGRCWLPPVVAAASLDQALDMLPEPVCIVVGDVDGVAPFPLSHALPVAVVVGPEGGLADAERDTLRQRQALAWNLGPHRLRAETAAVAMLGAVAALRR